MSPIHSFSNRWVAKFIALAILVSLAGATATAGPKPAKAGKSASAAAKPDTIPPVTSIHNPCGKDERWVWGQDWIQTITPESRESFALMLNGKEPAVRGFAESAWLIAKAGNGAVFGDYWAGRAFYTAHQFGPAISHFAALMERSPTPATVPMQLAAMSCLHSVFTAYPIPVMSDGVANRLADYFRPGLVSNELKPALYEATIHAVLWMLKENKPTQSVEKVIDLLKGAGPYEHYARALWAVDRDKPEEAIFPLKSLATADTLPPSIREHQNELRLILARLYYDLGKYDESARYFDKIEKRSNAMVQALAHRPWLDIATGKYPKAVGAALALQTGGLRDTFAPEALMVAAMSLNELCLFPESLHMLQVFRRDYERPFRWLRDRSGPKATIKNEHLYPAALSFLKGETTTVPSRVASEWIRSPIFLASQQAINDSFAQDRLIDGLDKGAQAFLNSEASRLMDFRLKVAKKVASEQAPMDTKRADEAKKAANRAASEAKSKAAQLVKKQDQKTKRAAEAQQATRTLASATKDNEQKKLKAKDTAEKSVIAKQAATIAEQAAQAAKQVSDASTAVAKEKTKAADTQTKEAKRLATQSAKLQAEATTAAQGAKDAETKLKVANDAATAAHLKLEQMKQASQQAQMAFGAADAAVKSAQEAAKAAADAVSQAVARVAAAKTATNTAQSNVKKLTARAAVLAKQRAQAEKNAEAKAKVAEKATATAAEKAAAAQAPSAQVPDASKALLKAAATADAQAKRATASAAKAQERFDAAARAASEAEASLLAAKADLEQAKESAKNAALEVPALRKKLPALQKDVAQKTAQAAALSKRLTAANANVAKATDTDSKSAKVAQGAVEKAKSARELATTRALKATEASQMAQTAAAAEAAVRKVADEANAKAMKDSQVTQQATKVANDATQKSKKADTDATTASKMSADAEKALVRAGENVQRTAKLAAEAEAEAKKAVEEDAAAKVANTEAQTKASQASAIAKASNKRLMELAHPDPKAPKIQLPRFVRTSIREDVLEHASNELKSLVGQIEVAEDRQERLLASIPQWKQTLHAHQKTLEKKRQMLMAGIEKAIQRLNDRMWRQLTQVAENNEFIEAEIWNGASQDIVWQNAHPEYQQALKTGKLKPRKPATEGDALDWGSSQHSMEGKEEIWEDELGESMANLNDNCSNKERYLKLQGGGR